MTFTEIAEWDWIIFDSPGSRKVYRLHHLAALDDPKLTEAQWGGSGTTSCGLHAEWVEIPSFLTRLNAPRCDKCCEAVGFPPGRGSPKNDKVLNREVKKRLKKRVKK